MCAVYSYRYSFRTVEHLKDYKRKSNEKSMLNGVKWCISLYHTRELTVDSLNTDNELACIKNNILTTNLNMVAAEEYVRDVERSVITIKKGTCCHVQRLPYE